MEKSNMNYRKEVLRLGATLLLMTSAASLASIPSYAAATGIHEEAAHPEEIPGVLVSPGEGSDTTFQIVEVDTVWYRVTFTVVDRVTGVPLRGTTIYFERMNDDGRGSVGGIVYAKDSGNRLITTGEDGQLTFELEVGKNYRMFIITPEGYTFTPDADQPEYIQIDNGSQFQYRTIYLDPKQQEPVIPDPGGNGGGSGGRGNGGGGNGGSHGNDRNPGETTPDHRETIVETTAPMSTLPVESMVAIETNTSPGPATPGYGKPSVEEGEDAGHPDVSIVPIVKDKTDTTDDVDIDHWKCWYHWLEILAMGLMLMLFFKRLIDIQRIHKDLDEMEDEMEKESGEEYGWKQ